MTPERIKKSEDFLDKWGHLAIFLGRFFPFIRTFVPFIAGMGGMHWRNFVIFNVLGGITWSTLFTLLGYFFGGIPFVQEHFELLIIGIVAVSSSRPWSVWLRLSWANRTPSSSRHANRVVEARHRLRWRAFLLRPNENTLVS